MPLVTELEKARLISAEPGVELATSIAVVAVTAAASVTTLGPGKIVFIPPPAGVSTGAVGVTALDGERYPALVRIWDNDDDAIYDQV